MIRILLALVLWLGAEGERFVLPVDGERASVEFVAVGRPAIKIRGSMARDRASALTGTFRVENHRMTGEARLALDSLETGIALRDRHMKEKYLETGKYPTARFQLTDLLVPRDFKDGFEADEAFKGRLTLREREKPVEGRVKLKGDAGAFRLVFDFTVKTSDFKMETPSFMGVTVAEDVAVTVEMTLPLKRSGT